MPCIKLKGGTPFTLEARFTVDDGAGSPNDDTLVFTLPTLDSDKN
jgi:hypothetical protein